MRVSELFYSIQGEGVHSGLPTYFIRLQGCPFRCEWCDTMYARDPAGGVEMSISDLVGRVQGAPTRRVCLTGGEPLAQVETLALLETLRRVEQLVEVETSGLAVLPLQDSLKLATSWVVDVKCPSSGMSRRNLLSNLGILRPCDQVKFVVQHREDFEYALQVVQEFPTKAHLLVSPVWGGGCRTSESLETVASWVKEEMPQARLSVQLHKVIYGNRKGV